MNPKKTKSHSIASLLFRTIFGSYFVITFLVTMSQLSLEYFHVKDNIQEEIRRLPATFERGIADSIWTYNTDLLKSILTGMNEIPVVVGVKIEDNAENPLQIIGQIQNSEGGTATGLYSLFSHHFPIRYTNEYGESEQVGVGTIYSSTELVVDRVVYGFILILINSMIKVLALYTIFLFFVRKYLGVPLGSMAHDISSIRLDDLENASIQVKTPEENELKVLEASFNKMLTKLSLETKRIQEISLIFQKFVPQQFLNRIATHGIETIEFGKAQTEEVTILFSDIRDFTSISESKSPQEVLNFLNTYLHKMDHPIRNNNGFVDKFIGDALMALFDDPGHSATHSVSAALAMINELERYNKLRLQQGDPPMHVGIGIHTGDAIFGTIGSQDRMDSTVLGDSVNLASRIEELTKLYKVQIIISDNTYHLLEGKDSLLIRELDYIRVRGKERPERIYEIYNGNPLEVRDNKIKMQKLYERGLQAYYAQDWGHSIYCFKQCHTIMPEDAVVSLYLDRCQRYQSHPPLHDWDGAFAIDSK